MKYIPSNNKTGVHDKSHHQPMIWVMTNLNKSKIRMKQNNKIRSLTIFFILILLVGFTFSCHNEKTEPTRQLNAGVANIDITPPIGYPVHKTPSDGVLDPLEVKTIVFKQGNCQAALVLADLFFMPKELSETVRKFASEKTGIPVSNICVAATHTHADPTCCEEIEEFVQKMNAGNLTSQEENSYPGELIGKSELLNRKNGDGV